ncbi:glycosyltransferase family 2 protein [Weissella paramesenteroides]|uniref:glycosyltransferase family 2 protein n=1 Tax=Weissella paramesenteroides TaxID=1249 RepID=UPI003D35F0B5
MVNKREFPLISIIMPVFNVELYLKDSIESVLTQTYSNFELIIIDDGSTDNSAEEIKKIRARTGYKNIQFIQTDNKGLSMARNLGIKKSVGQYIYFLDSDDFLETNFIEKITDEIQDKNCDMVIFNYNKVDNMGNKIFENGMHITNNIHDSKRLMTEYLEGNIQNYAWSYVAKKDLYCKNKIFFPIRRAYEDIVVFPKLLYFSKKPIFIKEKLYNYRQRDNSITNETKAVKVINYLADYLSNIEYNKKWMLKYLINNYKKNLDMYFLNHYIQIFMIATENKYFPYENIRPVVKIISENVRVTDLKEVSFKKIILIYLFKLGFGKFIFRIMQLNKK